MILFDCPQTFGQGVGDPPRLYSVLADSSSELHLQGGTRQEIRADHFQTITTGSICPQRQSGLRFVFIPMRLVGEVCSGQSVDLVVHHDVQQIDIAAH